MAPIEQLIKVGFNYRQAEVLTTQGPMPTARVLHVASFTPRQTRTLIAGSITMAKLLRGGFTRAQAKLMLAA